MKKNIAIFLIIISTINTSCSFFQRLLTASRLFQNDKTREEIEKTIRERDQIIIKLSGEIRNLSIATELILEGIEDEDRIKQELIEKGKLLSTRAQEEEQQETVDPRTEHFINAYLTELEKVTHQIKQLNREKK